LDEKVIHQRIVDMIYIKYQIRISDENNLTQEIGLDSMQILELIMGLEEEFAIIIPDEQLDPDLFQTIKNIVNLVEMQMQ